MFLKLDLKFIKLVVMTIVMIVIFSCVPKATEKNALCGTNEAFNSVTRTCYSVVETRYVPAATLSTYSLNQEIAPTTPIELTYTDKNKDSAISCQISGVSSQVNLVAPVIYDTTMLAKASDLQVALNNLQVAFNAYSTTHLTDANAASATAISLTNLNSFNTNLQALNKTNYLPTYEAYIVTLKGFAQTIVDLSNTGSPTTLKNSDLSINYLTVYANDALTAFSSSYTSIQNKCSCSAGKCTTYIIPKKGFSGTAGFSYTITDNDGTSAPQSVVVNVSSYGKTLSHQKPTVQSVYVSGAESNTSTPAQYNFSLGTTGDYFSPSSINYYHTKTSLKANIPGYSSIGIQDWYIVSDNGLGKITGCVGSTSVLTSTNCTYVPNDGDANEALVATIAQTAPIGDLTYKAYAKGLAGNDIKIYYADLNSTLTGIDPYATSIEKFGLVDDSSEAYIRVYGNNIYVFFHDGLTTTQKIKSLIESDPTASNLVSITKSGAAGVVATVASASSGVSLSGGVGAYDEFSYKINNGYQYSTNTTKATFHITATDDIPVVPRNYNLLFSQTNYFVEGSAGNAITVPFKDVDTAAGSFIVSAKIETGLTCTSSMTNTYFNTLVSDTTNFTLALSAAIPSYNATTKEFSKGLLINANNDFVGNACLYYTVSDGVTTTLPQVVSLRVLKLNDTPTVAMSSYTLVTSGVAGSAQPATVNIPMNESTTSTPTSAYACFTSAAGGGSDELTQTITPTVSLVGTPVPSDLINTGSLVVLKPGDTGYVCTSPQFMVTWGLKSNVSGTAQFLITIADNGIDESLNASNAVISTSHSLSATYNLGLTVSNVNDYPVLSMSASTYDMNEGGYIIAGPFYVAEDAAFSPDEKADGITVTYSSDNQALLMNSQIHMFYDLNDNGIEDSGESRASGAQLESSAGNDAYLHAFYFQLTPVGGTSGSVNITLVATDGAFAAPANLTTSKSFSLVVNPISAIHGGWNNLSSVGIKTDKNNAPASPSDIACNYNKVTDPINCGAKDCTGNTAPFGTTTVTAPGVIYWDNQNLKCYRSYFNTTSSSYVWQSFNTYCPVTASTTLCGEGKNCIFPNIHNGTTSVTAAQVQTYCGAPDVTKISIGTSSPAIGAAAPVNQVYYNTTTKQCFYSNNIGGSYTWQSHASPTATDQYYYDTSTNLCFKSKQVGSDIYWDTTTPTGFIPSKVTLAWKPFTLSGSGSELAVSIKGYNVYRRESGYSYDFSKQLNYPNLSVSDSSTLTYTDKTAVAGRVYYYTVRPVDTNHSHATYTPDSYSEVRLVAPPPNYAFVHRWMINQEVCNKMHMTTSTTPYHIDTSNNFRCDYFGLGSTGGYYDYGSDLLVDVSEMGCPYTLNTGGGNCTNGSNGCIGEGAPGGFLSSVVNGDIYYDRSSGTCYQYSGGWVNYNTIAAASIGSLTKHNTALNPPLVNITASKGAAICAQRTIPTIYKNLYLNTNTMTTPTNFKLPEKKDYIAYSAAPWDLNDTQISDLEKGDSLNGYSRCNGSSASGLENYFTDSDLPTSSYIYTLPGTFSSGIRSLYTGSVPWGYNKSTESCTSRYGIQDLYGNVAEWTTDKMSCNSGNKVCAAAAGTSIFDTLNAINGKIYALDLFVGPYDDSSGNGASGDATDSFITSWNFEDKSFDGTKFNFPTALPFYANYSTFIACPALQSGAGDPNGVVAGGGIYLDQTSGKCYQWAGGTAWTDVSSSYTTAPLTAGTSFILDIGSTNGLTFAQLHGDGMLVNGANIGTGTGVFAVGGSYLSNDQSGRYTSELVPQSTTRADIGFRCIIPISDY